MNVTLRREAQSNEELRQQAVSTAMEIQYRNITGGQCARGQYYYLLDEITKSAQKHAETENISDDDFSGGPLDDAISLVSDIHDALHPYDPDEERRWRPTFWEHQRFPLERIQKNKTPAMSRAELEAVVGKYLDLPFRSKVIDRILVDALIALELYAFGNEMFNQPSIPILAQNSPMKKRHVLVSFLIGQAVDVVVFFGLAALALYLDWPVIAGILALLFFIFLLIGLFRLPSAWSAQRTLRRRVAELMQLMVSAYTEVGSQGPISTSRVRELVNQAANKGVAWPAPLHALLEDMAARSPRF